jgi:hypothetical protein
LKKLLLSLTLISVAVLTWKPVLKMMSSGSAIASTNSTEIHRARRPRIGGGGGNVAALPAGCRDTGLIVVCDRMLSKKEVLDLYRAMK